MPMCLGDGVRTDFALVKRYGAHEPEIRRITRPVPGSLLVAVAGLSVATGWSAVAGGTVSFATPPAYALAGRGECGACRAHRHFARRRAATAPRLVVAASGPSPGWRRAALLLSLNGGSSWDAAGFTALPATIGTAATLLAAGSPLLQDRAASVEVSLLNGDMVLGDADDMAIGAGRNLALLGDELIQFRAAAPLGANRYRLSGLDRGLFGTEWAVGAHAANERFVLIEEETLASVSVPTGTAEVRVMAAGLGDETDPPQQILVTPGLALVPPAPVHLAAVRLANGDTRISWVRRSRVGWRWVDGVDAPLGEEREAYEVQCKAGARPTRVEQVPDPGFLYDAAARAADISAGAASITVAVRQIGQFGPSRAAFLTFPLS